jgi:dimethylhistidine N-methyltransferase
MTTSNMHAGRISVLEPGFSPEELRQELLAGLCRTHKKIPCKFLYDETGSQLFEKICALEDYYVTRTELEILNSHTQDIARELGSETFLVELGSGSGIKTRLLLQNLQDPIAYVPVDISRDMLLESSLTLQHAFPNLEILPVCADYTRPFPLPIPTKKNARQVSIFFPGSTIGNFEPVEAAAFLRRLSMLCRNGSLVIGVDLRKDPSLITAAYDDKEGVTAAFNLNLINRINREFGVDLDPKDFSHSAIYDVCLGRVEMHLVCQKRRRVKLDGHEIHFEMGERIHTEYSYKYSLQQFRSLARLAGFEPCGCWTDKSASFGVFYLESRPRNIKVILPSTSLVNSRANFPDSQHTSNITSLSSLENNLTKNHLTANR